MRILHLSDYHYKSLKSDKFSEDNIIDKLCTSLKEQKNNIDLVLFTGDLVFSGKIKEEFYEAKRNFLDKISIALNIDSKKIIICPGNHDVDRDCKLESLEHFIDNEIKDNSSLNKFISEKSNDYNNSIKGIINYNSFKKECYPSNIEDSDLFSVDIKEISGISIGILVINSAWRSLEDNSFGKLLFPTQLLEKALSSIKQCSCKIVLLHHPLFWFKEYNHAKLQEIIHKEFDIIFSGHIHDSQISTHYKYNNGIFAHVAQASMTYDKSYVGYSIIDYDITTKEQVIITNTKYVNDFNKFISDDPIAVKIPCGEEKEYQNRIRTKIKSKLKLELLTACDLLLNNENEENDELFIDLFNTPVLRYRSKSEISISEKQSRFEFEKILLNENNYLIYGHDKSGKTSLLKYIQIQHLKKYSNNGNIPFYIDFRELDTKIDQNWSLLKYMSRYFELSVSKTKLLIEKHNIRLLIDNFDPNHKLFEIIHLFLNRYPNVRFVACSEQLASRTIEEYNLGEREYSKLYLHDITRREVRTYSEKWFDKSFESKDEVLDKLVSFCKQLEMPLNYWTISILLLIHKKSRFDMSKNLYEILDLCVDEILNKKYITLSKSKLNFKQLKSICSKLAHFLLIKHGDEKYSASYSMVLNHIEEEVKSNIRLTANPKEILEYLINSGVLKIKSDDTITFRLNGVFEYFIAYNMSQNKSFRDQIISDNNVYLSFKNELEIYSGLNNGNVDFLKEIFEKSKSFFEPINKAYEEQGVADKVLTSITSESYDDNLGKIVKALKVENPLLDEAKDNLKDSFSPVDIQGEIMPKKTYNISKLDSEIFERYVSILAKIYKTMDEVSDPALLNDILDFLLETYINFGFFLIKEIENEKIFKESVDVEIINETEILNLLNKFIPIITQVTFSDSIAHYNVEAIILNKLRDLKNSTHSDQYKVFILYFILMDIDEKNIEKYADELIDYMRLGLLKYSVILKLNYYFSFNGHRNKKIADFLKIKIQKLQMELNNKTDETGLQKSLDKRKKINLLKR
ncbi:metallophosphoesterase [Marinifilum fragile]|uniref:metallophosphoesterase n=1 Tax=Marinifilum fragile TaxID=570161 RepID=UPI002AA6DE96|nr:metallophosphoesterase [Marinifilum fragile]